jgi:maltose alpha-D-glucosyltransferase/alpha-amylase
MDVHPSYGSLDDFRALLSSAHERNLQVMIELVINHTSDQHPWFQAARNAPAGSPERDFYVWSDTGGEYKDVRIIFTDTEKSNWTWDPVAKAYFWHRFFSHQPDLNFDNPHVLDEVLKIMRFWLDLGVDGLRLDAIPYLIEREGTSCENLPETHVIIKRIRAAMDAGYSNRMILAEANQWPSDVRPYFGEGDECNMAFHFPVMPRIYMALRQEDRMPIIDIMAQTPGIPDTCQWGLFLRNHDELTLEMVTSDERDYMYLAYSADPRTRINLGIRRRLAPLMDNNRRRIELLNSLLFSLPGTPIIYYGDEIGMGDNVYLGDRNGVRTPMQWNSDRNAGFSRANPAMLYSPVIMDPVWGYQALNVEAEESDPSSLLNWMRNMIALRRLFRVFGRGTLRFLNPVNRKILAYVRSLDGEQVLCVTNLSRYAQPVDLDLSDLAGMTPVEMLGYVEFPPIASDPYRLTLGPYGFLWLELHDTAASQRVAVPMNQVEPAPVRRGWSELVPELETSILPAYLPKQRWFAGKSRQIQDVRVVDWTQIEAGVLLFLHVTYASGEPEHYVAPFVMRNGSLQDGLLDDSLCVALMNIKNQPTQAGRMAADLPAEVQDAASMPIVRGSVEQSNSSIIFGSRIVLKLFRRRHEGVNPEVEMARHLASAGFARVPVLLGTIEYSPKTGSDDQPAWSAIAMLQRFVQNEGDGWTWTLDELDRFYEHCARLPAEVSDESIQEQAGACVEAVRVLGRRTAELHLALSRSAGDPAFEPEDFSDADIRGFESRIREEVSGAFDLLRASLASLPDDTLEMAGIAIRSRRLILDKLQLPAHGSYGKRIRVHGDYHLGQVLRSLNDFYIVDFEGEPARSLSQRRARYSPLKDVAGMVRSFSYAAGAGLISYTARHPETFSSMERIARVWENTVRDEFLTAYFGNRELRSILPAKDESLHRLLDACVLEKAVYELGYELNSRPSWVRIPLAGILSSAGV